MFDIFKGIQELEKVIPNIWVDESFHTSVTVNRATINRANQN